MKMRDLTIEGMSCGHCVMHVKKALSGLPDVRVEDVQIGRATIEIDESKVTKDILAAAVEKAGYRLVSVQ